VINDEQILLFSNAIQATINTDTFIGKEMRSTKRVPDAPDCKKALLQVAGMCRIKVHPQIQHLITVQTNALIEGNSKAFNGTKVVSQDDAVGMFKLFESWISNLQTQVDSHGVALCAMQQDFKDMKDATVENCARINSLEAALTALLYRESRREQQPQKHAQGDRATSQQQQEQRSPNPLDAID